MRHQAKPFTVELKRSRTNSARAPIWTEAELSRSFEPTNHSPLPSWKPELESSIVRRPARILPDLTLRDVIVEERMKTKPIRRAAASVGRRKVQGGRGTDERV